MDNAYKVTTQVSTFYVPEASVEVLMPEFEAFVTSWMTKQSNAAAQRTSAAYKFLKDQDLDLKTWLATLLAMPFMSFKPSEKDSKNAEEKELQLLGANGFVKLFGQKWFKLNKLEATEQKGALEAMAFLMFAAIESLGLYKAKTIPHPTELKKTLTVFSKTPKADTQYPMLGLEMLDSVAQESGPQPSTSPIVYDEAPWLASVSDEFIANQTPEHHAKAIKQATEASSVAFVVDPHLAEVYLAWSALK